MPSLPPLPPGAPSVAIVGSGVAGLTAAHRLQQRFRVTLFEREARPGGHTNTIVIPDGPDAGTPVDTGFIVFNDRNYPRFRALLSELGVASRPSDMTFSYHEEASGFHYAGTSLDGLFSHRPSLLSPAWWGTIVDVLRFNDRARRDLAGGSVAGITLGEYLERLKLSRNFAARYLIPMGAAIWSSSRDDLRGFPAESFLRFFEQHGLLGVTGAPRWWTVEGGSQAYVHALLGRLRGEVRLGLPVRALRREDAGVEVATEAGTERFDHVVIAAHADEALALLADPSADERRLLGAWRYSRNHTVLHTDERVLPPRRRAWASWNYRRERDRAAGGEAPVSVTYWMNRLQRLATHHTYCVTLNRSVPIPGEHVVMETVYTHPVFDRAALDSQRGLAALQGARATWYCGSYHGWGFHEDAVRSAHDVADRLEVIA
jgi:predicted NAD/FAD-binding protein